MGARGNAALIAELRALFAAYADPARASPMRSYMKSALPFYGIAAPLRRRLMAQAVRLHPARSTAELGATMKSLWRGAGHREEWYAAMELARVGAAHKRLLSTELVPLYEEMIVHAAWWDVCDDISGTALAGLLKTEPATMKPLLRRWAQGDNLWLRRAAIVVQRRLREPHIDPALMYEAIEASLDDPRFKDEFFIRKAIGWALRERSYAAPREVREYCEAQAARLSPLARREALKALARKAAAPRKAPPRRG
jgi:3-methyladenine DNA glycosylase AlkD